MSLLPLPDWLPWWVPIVVLVPALLWALAFLSMPFAVFGVKGRLEAIEARLDEIQGEIRSLALRMPEPVHHARYDEAIYSPPPSSVPGRALDGAMGRPPIPPARHQLDEDEWEGDPRPPRRPDAARTGRGEPRAEPRLDRPR